MISRFHFSQKDNKKDIKENESLPGMEKLVIRLTTQ